MQKARFGGRTISHKQKIVFQIRLIKDSLADLQAQIEKLEKLIDNTEYVAL